MHKKRKTFGAQFSSRKPSRKVCDENESRKKKRRRRLKYFCGEEGVYKARAVNLCNGYQTTSAQRFLIH